MKTSYYNEQQENKCLIEEDDNKYLEKNYIVEPNRYSTIYLR
jgi:hypothetical protein